MFVKLIIAVLAFLAANCNADEFGSNQVVCFYDSKQGFSRHGEAYFHPKYLSEAASYCNYLIYGFASINKKDYTLESSNPGFDIHQFKAYQEVVSLKNSNPNLRVLLSVGGGRDLDHLEKYLYLLESFEKRHDFIFSAIEFVKKYGFDGLDLAWQFPPNRPKIIGFWSSAWNTIKTPFIGHGVDSKSFEHKQQFVDLVTELKTSCRNNGLTLSLSVLPNVNSTLFYNVPLLIPNLDFVNLWAFDYHTADRNPKEADLPAPLYPQVKRNPYENGEHLVEYWCENGAPSRKLYLGIPTFARTWKITNPDVSCFPPVIEVEGPGIPGVATKEAGLLSFPEVHHKLKHPLTVLGASTTVKEGFTKHQYASYGLFASDGSKHRDTWAGFDEPTTAAYKATYARKRGLAGIAVVDLTLDDFEGLCTGVKYPILRAVSSKSSESKIPQTTIPSLYPDLSGFSPSSNEPGVYRTTTPTEGELGFDIANKLDAQISSTSADPSFVNPDSNTSPPFTNTEQE